MAIYSIKNKPFFCSWSGGKDSCLALYRAIRAGGVPRILFTMMAEDGSRSRAHAFRLSLLQAQAGALGIPLVVNNASWDEYEDVFLSAIKGFNMKGINHGVFGDIDIEGHIQWVNQVCSSAGIKPYEPLWHQERKKLLGEFISLGFKAVIIAVKENMLGEKMLGKTLDEFLVREFETSGIDASGEEGEYHTLVIDGPTFSSSIEVHHNGHISTEGYSFLDISVEKLKTDN